MQPVIKDQSSKHDKVPSGSKRVGRANESNKANKLLTTGKALALLSMLEELLLLVTGFLQSATKPDLGLGSRCHFIRTASCLGLVMQPALRQHHCACLGSTLEDPDSQTKEKTQASAVLKAYCMLLVQPQRRTTVSEAQSWNWARQRAYPTTDSKENRKKTDSGLPDATCAELSNPITFKLWFNQD